MHCSNGNQSAAVLLASGLCEACHAQAERRRVAIIQLARQQYEQEGQVEIDDAARLSEGNDNGCYVQAWVWIGYSGTRFDQEKGATTP